MLIILEYYKYLPDYLIIFHQNIFPNEKSWNFIPIIKVVEIESGGNLMSAVQDLDFLPGFALEGFPNRDSTIYKDLYGLNNVHTILRGTLRFKGFSNTIRILQYLRLTDSNPHPSLHPNGPDITWVCIYIYIYISWKKSIWETKINTKFIISVKILIIYL